jgi:hypothetical protein
MSHVELKTYQRELTNLGVRWVPKDTSQMKKVGEELLVVGDGIGYHVWKLPIKSRKSDHFTKKNIYEL